MFHGIPTDTSYLELVALPILVAGFVVAFSIQSRLHKYVSREKVVAAKDVTRLWRGAVPPKEVLDDRGLNLYRLFRLAMAVCFAALLAFVAGGIADVASRVSG